MLLLSVYTQSVQNIRNTFLILSFSRFCPQNCFNSSRHGLYKVSKEFHRDAGPCRLQCLPQLCQIGWMSFGWWTILDTLGKLLSVKNPAVLQFLTYSNLPTTITRSKALKYFVLPIHPLNGTDTQFMSQSMSRLKNPSLTCLPSSTLIEVERAGVHNVLCTKCISTYTVLFCIDSINFIVSHYDTKEMFVLLSVVSCD
ncbi:hypothetical protein J4Q44_G00330480 [Coregonus suidteri]|uniref:Uncharacterized protein n=1 Tax=Coregonus suidteri TaxID=861788 RepID=A0AAN8L1S6_9TELE